MAVKFRLPDGSDSDLVMHSYNGFPTATADEFRQLLVALAASGPNAPKPTPLEKFFETHPIAKTFLTAEKPAPVSYATMPYFGVNSFKFTNAKGDSTFVRYQMVPEGGAQYLTKEQLAAAGPNYLADEIRKRVGGSPVRMKLQVQPAEAGDKIDASHFCSGCSVVGSHMVSWNDALPSRSRSRLLTWLHRRPGFGLDTSPRSRQWQPRADHLGTTFKDQFAMPWSSCCSAQQR